MDGRQAAAQRFEQLQGYLAADPDNLRLIADAADTAFAAGRTAQASALIDRHAVIAAPPASLINLLGLCALEEGRYDDAERIFATLASDSGGSASVAFNLAWARERQGNHQGAVEALAGPLDVEGALLKIRCLHHLGRLEEAMALADPWDEASGSPALWGALSSVAVDAEDLARARVWSGRAAGDPDGEATAGMIALTAEQTEEARRHFEAALALRPDFARGRLGLGSIALQEERPAEAARHFDAAAEVFEDHLGSWVAAGWAWMLADDEAQARHRFETALGLDDTFAETWAGLALLDLRSGRPERAREQARRAVRLDSASPGAALARVVLERLDNPKAATAEAIDRELQGELGGQGSAIRRLLSRRRRTAS